MIVADTGSSTSSSAVRHSATITWEQRHHAPETIWFEVDGQQGEPIDPNAFLLAVFPLAVRHGEKRIAINGPISPLLRQRLVDVHEWWRHWGLTSSRMATIESTFAENPSACRTDMSAAFLSGGVDSLHMLHQNASNFALHDKHRITCALLVRGFDTTFREDDQRRTYDLAARQLGEVAKDCNIDLLRITTNLREIDDDLDFWVRQFHGAALAAIAHASTSGRAMVRIAATYDIPNMAPWGSHPLIDSNFSTERIAIIHEGISFSRLEKVRELSQWPAAFNNMKVCTEIIPDALNCGRCEKCVRTKLEIVAVGAAVPESFADPAVEPEMLSPIRNPYQASCYRDIIEPLRDGHRAALAAAVELKLREYKMRAMLDPWSRRAKDAIGRIDERWSGGAIKTVYRRARGFPVKAGGR